MPVWIPTPILLAEARNRVLEALLTFCLPVKPWKTMTPDVPIYGGIECGNGASASSAPENVQRSDTGLKAPPALGGSAMVARPARRQIFAVNGTAPARHDRRAEPGHSTSEMIHEDMKIL